MKKLSFLLLSLMLACGPEDATPTTPANDTFDETKATLLREGSWMGSGSYNVSGVAQIYDDNEKNIIAQ